MDWAMIGLAGMALGFGLARLAAGDQRVGFACVGVALVFAIIGKA